MVEDKESGGAEASGSHTEEEQRQEEEGDSQEKGDKIQLTVKTTKESHTVLVEKGATVEQVVTRLHSISQWKYLSK